MPLVDGYIPVKSLVSGCLFLFCLFSGKVSFTLTTIAFPAGFPVNQPIIFGRPAFQVPRQDTQVVQRLQGDPWGHLGPPTEPREFTIFNDIYPLFHHALYR